MNDVDHALDLTFTDNLNWRSKVTAVNVDGTPLTAGQYSLSAGSLTINQGIIQTPGNHTIVIEATGYAPSQVSQTVNVGAISLATSTAVLTPNSSNLQYLPVVNEITLTAKDQYGNPIPNYVFKHITQITDTDDSVDTIEVDGVSFTGTVSDVKTFQPTELTPTDSSGVIMFTVELPTTNYSMQIDVYLNDGTTFFF
ncbi:DUF1533 domain-containing protein [Brevibacillus centrosporus]|uniref:DUF1533 domain-containing protein n=1 Tax=Brevibacillus centrosporus TaxID=54910 RepID=UPI002E22D418|nr:DUF1533 domain-containing protein [Brevibacillus centrosporus]